MAVADVAPSRLYVPWSQHWIAASGLSPWLAAVALAAAQFASLFAVFTLGVWAGFADLQQPWFWREMAGPQVVMSLLVGYAPAALAWSHRSALDQLDALRPLLDDPAHAAFRVELAGFPRARLALAGGAFAAGFVPLVLLDPRLAATLAEATSLG